MIQQFVASQSSALQNLVSSEKILVCTHNVLNLSPSCVNSSHMIFVDGNILGPEY